jgi:hypothetical protein
MCINRHISLYPLDPPPPDTSIHTEHAAALDLAHAPDLLILPSILDPSCKVGHVRFCLDNPITHPYFSQLVKLQLV